MKRKLQRSIRDRKCRSHDECFAKRLKNGRSWVDNGGSAMMTGLVVYLDNMAFKTVFWTNGPVDREQGGN